MSINYEIKSKLLQFGIKPTLQRIAIMDYLAGRLTHPTAEIILNDLSSSIPTLSKATIYSALKLFEERGIIQAINIDEKNVRYDSGLSRHAHFKCKKCGIIIDIPLEDIFIGEIEDSEEYFVTDLQVYYKGFCKHCKK